MPNKTTRICCLLFVLLIELAATLWFSVMQPYYQEIDTGPSPLARKNPYLAAQQYLNSSGAEVFTTQKLDRDIDISKYHTLFISHAGQVVSKKQAQQLLSWMSNGGHIIVSAQKNGDEDPLLSLFSITREDTKPKEIEETEKTEENIQRFGEQLTASDEKKESEMLTELHFKNVEGSIQVALSSSHGLHHPYINDYEESIDNTESADYTPSYWAHDDNGIQFIQFNHGDGLLSVLSSNRLWNNHSIANHDHAYLLSVLVGKNSKVVILYGSQIPNLFTLLWQNAPELSTTFFLIIIFSLWHFGQRFGPMLELTSTARRSFSEHLLASGEYLWRMKKSATTLETLRKDLFKQLQNSAQQQVATDRNSICKFFAQKHSYPEQEIFHALYSQSSVNEQEFITLIRLLQQLREQL